MSRVRELRPCPSVEGVDACTAVQELEFPFTEEDWDQALSNVEDEAQEIWDSTHGCDECGLDGAINPECKTCRGEGVIL